MKAWTYGEASRNGPYWRSGTVDIILIDCPDGSSEWRRVDTGAPHRLAAPTSLYHRAKLLSREDWPQWLRDLDDYDMDEGL